MPMAPFPAVTVTAVAYFPDGYFLDKLAVRADGSVLVTSGPTPAAQVTGLLTR
jgi:hypothetical protein